MAIVKGQIESLRRLRVELDNRGIHRFNSIADINAFLSTYQYEMSNIHIQKEEEFNRELDSLRHELSSNNLIYNNRKREETVKLERTIEELAIKLNAFQTKNFVIKLFKYAELKLTKTRKSRLEKNFNSIISQQIFSTSKKISDLKKQIAKYENERNSILAQRIETEKDGLKQIKHEIDSLYPIITGAIGENLVVNELQKLPDKYIILNDFSVEFDTPIYNRKEDDKIFSIQIDHLLISNAGVFILETKNWSNRSIQNLDLRSPIKQVNRSSYALFVLLNSNSNLSKSKLKNHHWGEKQIPIRNVIVMIKNKPKEKFKFVEVKTLNELIGYISFFEPIFMDSEVREICNYLERIQLDKDTKTLNQYLC